MYEKKDADNLQAQWLLKSKPFMALVFIASHYGYFLEKLFDCVPKTVQSFKVLVSSCKPSWLFRNLCKPYMAIFWYCPSLPWLVFLWLLGIIIVLVPFGSFSSQW